jgi:hypothetical protein
MMGLTSERDCQLQVGALMVEHLPLPWSPTPGRKKEVHACFSNFKVITIKL